MQDMVKFNGPKKSKLCLKISKEKYFIYLTLYNFIFQIDKNLVNFRFFGTPLVPHSLQIQAQLSTHSLRIQAQPSTHSLRIRPALIDNRLYPLLIKPFLLFTILKDMDLKHVISLSDMEPHFFTKICEDDDKINYWHHTTKIKLMTYL